MTTTFSLPGDADTLDITVNLLEPTTQRIYALEMYTKMMLPCKNINNKQVKLSISAQLAYDIITAQRRCTENFARQSPILLKEDKDLSTELTEIFGGDAILVRLSHSKGKNMLVSYVGLGMTQNKDGKRSLELRYNWNGTYSENHPEYAQNQQVCPIQLGNIIRYRDHIKRNVPYSGLWDIGKVCLNHIDRNQWPNLERQNMNIWTYSILLGLYLPIGLSQLLMTCNSNFTACFALYLAALAAEAFNKVNQCNVIPPGQIKAPGAVQASAAEGDHEARLEPSCPKKPITITCCDCEQQAAGAVRASAWFSGSTPLPTHLPYPPHPLPQPPRPFLYGPQAAAPAQFAPHPWPYSAQTSPYTPPSRAPYAHQAPPYPSWNPAQLPRYASWNPAWQSPPYPPPLPQAPPRPPYAPLARYPFPYATQPPYPGPIAMPQIPQLMPGQADLGVKDSQIGNTIMLLPVHPEDRRTIPMVIYPKNTDPKTQNDPAWTLDLSTVVSRQPRPCNNPTPPINLSMTVSDQPKQVEDPCDNLAPPINLSMTVSDQPKQVEDPCNNPARPIGQPTVVSAQPEPCDDPCPTPAGLEPKYQAQNGTHLMDMLLRLLCDAMLASISTGLEHCAPYRSDVGEDIGLIMSLWAYLNEVNRNHDSPLACGDCEDLAQKFVQLCRALHSFLQTNAGIWCPDKNMWPVEMVRCMYLDDSRGSRPENIYHTLAAVLWCNKSGDGCHLRLVECTCSQLIMNDPPAAWVRKVSRVMDEQFASRHYQCIEWFGKYAVYEFCRGKLRHGACAYRVYAGRPVVVESGEELQQKLHALDVQAGEVYFVLLDVKVVLRGLQPFVDPTTEFNQEAGDRWARYVQVLELIGDGLGRVYFKEESEKVRMFCEEWVRRRRMEKEEEGGGGY